MPRRGRSLSLPQADLPPGKTYTATLSAAADLAGNPLSAPVVWSFTTHPGFQEAVVFGGLVEPTSIQFASRWPCLRRREERHRQGVRERHRHDPHRLRGPSHQGLQPRRKRTSRHGPRPRVPGAALRLRPLYVRRSHRRNCAGVGRRLPAGQRRSVRRQRAAVAATGQRQRHDGNRAGPGRGLVPALSGSARWGLGLRSRRRALRERRRRREQCVRRSRPGVQPEPRPAERRRRPTQPGSPDAGGSGRPQRHRHPRSPGYRRARAADDLDARGNAHRRRQRRQELSGDVGVPGPAAHDRSRPGTHQPGTGQAPSPPVRPAGRDRRHQLRPRPTATDSRSCGSWTSTTVTTSR